MKVAVVGATGNFGRVIVPRLLADPRVTGVVAIARRRYSSNDPRVHSISADVRDPGMCEYLQECEVVIHLAFVVSELRDKKLTREVNVLGTMNVIRAAAQSGARRVVVASSVNAYGSEVSEDFVTEDKFTLSDPDRYYFHDKSQVEHYVDWYRAYSASPLSIVTLRCSFVVGPDFSNPAIDAMCSRFAALPEADRASYQFLAQDDMAEAFALAAFAPSLDGAYNVAPPDRTSMRRLAALHGQVLVSLPMRAAVTIADALYRLRLLGYSGQWVTAGDISVDSSRFCRATGWKSSASSDDNALTMLRLNGREVRNIDVVERKWQRIYANEGIR